MPSRTRVASTYDRIVFSASIIRATDPAAIEQVEREAGARSVQSFRGAAGKSGALQAIAGSTGKLTVFFNGHAVQAEVGRVDPAVRGGRGLVAEGERGALAQEAAEAAGYRASRRRKGDHQGQCEHSYLLHLNLLLTRIPANKVIAGHTP